MDLIFWGGVSPHPPPKEAEQPPAVRPAPAMVFPDSRGGHRAAFSSACRAGRPAGLSPAPARSASTGLPGFLRPSPPCCFPHPRRGAEPPHGAQRLRGHGWASFGVSLASPAPPRLGWQWPVGFFMGPGWGGTWRRGDEKEEWVQQVSAWEGGLRGLFCSSPRALGGRGRSQPSGRCSS